MDHETIRKNMLAAEAWPEGTTADEKRLRGLLARRVGLTYGDDGELESSEPRPAIDFKRDSVDEIERKLYERQIAAMAKGEPRVGARPSAEVRFDDKGELDEVIGPDAHLEQMDRQSWFLTIGDVGIWFSASHRLTVNWERRADSPSKVTVDIGKVGGDKSAEVESELGPDGNWRVNSMREIEPSEVGHPFTPPTGCLNAPHCTERGECRSTAPSYCASPESAPGVARPDAGVLDYARRVMKYHAEAPSGPVPECYSYRTVDLARALLAGEPSPVARHERPPCADDLLP